MTMDALGWRDVTAVVEGAYPREGCGWITGGEVHAAAGGVLDGFAFADRDLLDLTRAQRSAPVVMFHSHPDGDDSLSPADVAGLALQGLPQLVIAVAGGRARAAALWQIVDGAARLLARYARDGAGDSAGWSAA